MEEKTYIDIDFDKEMAATDEIKRGTSELMKLVAEKVGELVWQVADDYINTHLESDVICNYQDAVRQEVIRLAHFWSKHKDDFYGKSLRKAILDEHKETILPLIKDELIERMEKEISDLNRRIQIMSEARNFY